MCGHNNTILANGVETCRGCGMQRTNNCKVDPAEQVTGEWQWPPEDGLTLNAQGEWVPE